MLAEPWDRLLPVGLAPAAGESLAGYLLCLAERNLSSPVDIAARTGLMTGGYRVPVAHASELPDEVAERFAASTGLTPQQSRGLTLASYGRLFTDVDGASSPAQQAWRSTPGRMWAWTARTKYCPFCLADSVRETGTPVWRLSWRTAWSFACVRHSCLLSDACPSCATPAGSDEKEPTLIPNGSARLPAAACRSLTNDGTCAEPFDGARAQAATATLKGEAADRVLAAQAVLDRLTASAQAPLAVALTCSSVGREVTPDQYLRDLRFLAVLHEAAAEAEGGWAGLPGGGLADDLACGPVAPDSTAPRQSRRAWALPPSTAAVNALLVTTAVETLALDPVSAQQALAPMFSSGTRTSRSVIYRVRYAGQPSQRLQDLLAISNRRALGTRALLDALPDHVDLNGLRADTVPALLPLDEHVARFAWVPGPECRTRRVVAVCLHQLAAGTSIEKASEALGLVPAASRMTFVRVLRDLAGPGDLPRFRDTLGSLATDWNTTPRPCYARRREALSGWNLPPEHWDEIVTHLRLSQGHTTVDWTDRILVASVYVWARVTGGEAPYCPLVTAEHKSGDRGTRLLARLRNMIRGEGLRLALDAYGDRLAAELDARLG